MVDTSLKDGYPPFWTRPRPPADERVPLGRRKEGALPGTKRWMIVIGLISCLVTSGARADEVGEWGYSYIQPYVICLTFTAMIREGNRPTAPLVYGDYFAWQPNCWDSAE